MAAKPPAVGVAKVTMVFLCSGRNFTDSFFIQHTGIENFSVVELNGICSGVLAQWNTSMAPLTSASCSIVQVTALDLSDTVGRQGVAVGTHAGTIAEATSPSLPLNCVCRVTFQVARRYRGAKPSINVSGRVKSDTSDDRTFLPAKAEAIAEAMDTIIATAVGDATSLAAQVGVSYIAEGVLRLFPLVSEVINTIVQERICTLRKRLGKPIVDLIA